MRPNLALLFYLVPTLCSFGQPSALNTFIESYTKAHHFSGTVLIQKAATTPYHKSFGLANRSFNVPNTKETKYKIASITKLFTAVLILQLAEEGRLDLQKPIKTYLPDYTGEASSKVNVHQLLNHTSGLANIDTVSSMESAIKNGIPVYQKPATLTELVAQYCSGKLVAEPGKVFSYNNADYLLLGKIMEQITGKPYPQVLQEKILHPLQMQQSGLLNQQDIVTGLADTYFYREDVKRLVKDLPVYMENWSAAGAMYSTSSDLLTFANALFGGKLLKKETLALLLKPGLDEYGYSVWLADWELGGKKYQTVQRPGSIMGAQCKLVHLLNAGITIIVLGNTNTTSVDDFVYELSKRAVK